MEDSYRPETPASSESCSDELTRSNSGASSLTVDDSKDTLLQGGNDTTDKCRGWTNEKHNTFLDCLEASFVKQLHRSMILRADSVEVNKSCKIFSDSVPGHVTEALEQFPVQHDGGWKKINTVREPPVVYIEADCRDCLKKLHSGQRHNVLDMQLCCKLHCKEKRARIRRFSSYGNETRSPLILSKPAKLQKIVGRITEGSGQNFVDEDPDENWRSKKMKRALADTPEQEQVVPTMNFGSSASREMTN